MSKESTSQKQQESRRLTPEEVDDFDELLTETLNDFENPNLLNAALSRDQQQQQKKGGSSGQSSQQASSASGSGAAAMLRENASTADLLKPLAGLSLDGLRHGAGDNSLTGGDDCEGGDENVDFEQLMNRLESDFGSLDKAVQELLEPSEEDDNDPEVRNLKEQLRGLASKVDTASPAELGEALANTLRSLDESVAAHSRHADAVHLPKPGSAPAGGGAPEATGSGLGGSGGASQEMLMPFMENLMHTLLSKDVIYPSLKTIRDGYPAWLEANAASLNPDELEANRQRASVVSQVCEQYEALGNSKPSDAQFDRILRLVQRMQALGPPPEELLGDSDLQNVMPQCPQM